MWRARRRPIAAGLTAILGAVVGVLVPSPSPALGATTSGLSARAHAISASLSADEQRLSTIGEAYVSARERYLSASSAIRASTVTLGVLAHEIATRRTELYHAAIAAYVGGGSDALGLVLTGNADQLDATSTYLRVASNTLSDAEISLDDAQRARVFALDDERHDAAVAHIALADALAERSKALATVGVERSLLDSVNGQLATLVAAEQAAAARAAAAAAAAAAARQAASTASGPSPSAGPPAAITTVATEPLPTGSIARDFAAIRDCESGDRYYLDTGNGYYGAYQFSLGTWEGLGGVGLPSSAAPATQDLLAYRLYLSSGFFSWPECAAILGL